MTETLLNEVIYLYIKNYHFIRLGGYDQTHKTLMLLKILYTGDSQLWYVSETTSKLIKNADAWTHPTESESTPASPSFKQIIQVIHMYITV